MSTTDQYSTPPGWNFLGLSKDGLWGKLLPSNTERETAQERFHRIQERRSIEAAQSANTLPANQRDRHYRAILDQLNLHPKDRADLEKRGFTPEQIELSGYKSVEQWQRVNGDFPVRLPGLNTAGDSLITSAPGYLCPVVDIDGYIAGLQLRLREPADRGRYRWVSRKACPVSLPNGEHPLPVFRAKSHDVAIVEGTGAKPFLASQRLGVTVVGAAGGQWAYNLQELRRTLERLNSETLTLYPDAGSPHDPHTMQRYQRLHDVVTDWGYTLQVAWWGQEQKGKPDIDELADLRQIQIISWAQFLSYAPARQDWLGLVLKNLRKRVSPEQSAQNLNSRLKIESFNGFEYQKGQRVATWQQAIREGYKFILDTSSTGEGKSFDAGNIRPDDFGVRQVMFFSGQHYNPTTKTLTAENGWVDLHGRHSGLIREETAGGSRLVRARAGEAAVVPANCSRNGVINVLRAKNIPGADSATLVCGTCPLADSCKHSSEGYGYGFLHQRRVALTAETLRLHPDSAPGNDYNYSQVVIIWDEPAESFKVCKEIIVTQQDIQQTVSHLALENPELFAQLHPLLSELTRLFDQKQGKYGIDHQSILQALVPVSEDLDIIAVRQALSPNLIDTLDPVVNEGVRVSDLPARSYQTKEGRVNLRRNFSENPSTQQDIAERTILKQWLPELIHTLQTGAGGLHLNFKTLTITVLDTRHREAVNSTQATIFLDATLTPEDLALKLGCSPEHIFVCRQTRHQRHPQNLTITQVMDLGKLSQQRGKERERRAKALVEHYRQLDLNTHVIDFKRFEAEADGVWWRDSRGTNDFEHTSTLILIGTPCRNIAALRAEYACMTGIYPTDDDSFTAWNNRLIRADMLQGIGRLRANRRSDEHLHVVVISDFNLSIPTNQVKAKDITLQAASKVERLEVAITIAVEEMVKAGVNVTQQAVAEAVNVSQSYISQRFKTLLQTLISNLNRVCNNSAGPQNPPPNEVISLVQSVLSQVSTPAEWTEIAVDYLELLEPAHLIAAILAPKPPPPHMEGDPIAV